MRQDELYHFGVKGMKWGERRARKKETRRHAKSSYKYMKKRERRKRWAKRAITGAALYGLYKSPSARALAIEGVKGVARTGASMSKAGYSEYKKLKHSDFRR